MRNYVINQIMHYANKNGIFYTFTELQQKSNEDLIALLVEEHYDYFSSYQDLPGQ